MTCWSLYDLIVIGFASTIERPTLPRVLAPVFRARETPEVILLPPLRLLADEVFDATVADTAEYEALLAQEKLTRFPEEQAKLNHDLWVAENGSVSYSPKTEVKAAFKGMFRTHLELAKRALTDRNFTAVARHAAVARACDPAHLDPLIVRAAGEKIAGHDSQLAFTCRIASRYISLEEFNRLVEALGGKEARGCAAMRNAALRKPQPLAA